MSGAVLRVTAVLIAVAKRLAVANRLAAEKAWPIRRANSHAIAPKFETTRIIPTTAQGAAVTARRNAVQRRLTEPSQAPNIVYSDVRWQ